MNYLKMYRDQIENVADYNDDYSYMLFELFAKEFVPSVIEEYLKRKKADIKVPFSKLEEFYAKKGLKISEIDKSRVIIYGKQLACYIKSGLIVGNLKDVIIAYYDFLQNDNYKRGR